MILNFPFFSERMDFKSIISYRGKNVYTTSFHRWYCFIRKIAGVLTALLAFFAWTASKSDYLVIVVQK